ncbi:MAG: hypothetical protein AB8G99_07120 [Planctomycetaceae bacterium]
MFNRKRSSRRRNVNSGIVAESLEHRRLLAVTVTASGKTAKIVGDGRANSVQLFGFGISGSDGTEVNLTESFRKNQFKVSNYVFDMKGGNDTVEIVRVFGAKKVQIKGGSGDNTASVIDSDITQLSIRNDEGRDTNRIVRTQIGPDGQRNGGKLDIRNGDGGSDTRITSGGPGSGQSMHTNKITIQNGEGSNAVIFEDIRLRKATVKIDQGEGRNFATFTNVDRVKNIIVRRKSSGECCIPGGLGLSNTDVEFGGVSLQTTGSKNEGVSDGSFLLLDSSTNVATRVLHRTTSVDQSFTQIEGNSTVEDSVKIYNKGVGFSSLKVHESGLGDTLLFDNDFAKDQFTRTAKVDIQDSLFLGTVQVQNAGTGALDLDINNAAFSNALLVKHDDGGSDARLVDVGVGSTFLYQAHDGADAVFIEDSIFSGKATITTDGKVAASDTDVVSIERGVHGRDNENTEFKDDLSISTGAGADTVALGGATLLPNNLLNVRGRAYVNGGTGFDALQLGRWATFDDDEIFTAFE